MNEAEDLLMEYKSAAINSWPIPGLYGYTNHASMASVNLPPPLVRPQIPLVRTFYLSEAY